MFKALACAAALTVCTTGAALAATDAPVQYNILLNGYCNTFQFNVYKNIYTTGITAGQGACASAYLVQGLNTSVKKFSGLVVTTTFGSASVLYTLSFDLVKQKFALYESNGVQYALVVTGTFLYTSSASTGNPGAKSVISQ